MKSTGTVTLRALLRAATATLENRLEAELLLAHSLRQTRAHLHTWPDRVCPEDALKRFDALVERRRNGEPVAYLLGHREFWTLDLKVAPAALIPRPETERLVELALQRIPGGEGCGVADLGTGSGAIALALAKERPHCRLFATERSPAALTLARENAERHGIANVAFFQGDWWQPLAGHRFHVAVSNPPYIPDSDPHLLQGDLPWEPRTALAAGADGLNAIRRIAAEAPTHLLPGGCLLLEHGYDQGEAVRELLAGAGMVDIETHRDLAALERVTSCRSAD